MTIGRSPKQTLWNLQILRFVAAAMVLWIHLTHEAVQTPGIASFTPFMPVFWSGGVDIFFVISGFIMYHIGAGGFGVAGAPRRFLVRRLIRLVPPYWAFTALALLAMALVPGNMAANSSSVGHILGSLFFLPVENPRGELYPVLILGWTLNYEMLFYAIFAAGLLLPRRAGLALIVAALIGIALSALGQPWAGPFRFWSNAMVLEFLFGIGLAMLHERGVRLSRPAGWALIAAGVACLVGFTRFGVTEWPFLFRFFWAGFPALLLCAGGALMAESGQVGPVRRAFVFGGDMSYALYLSHPFVLTAIAMVAPAIGLRDPWLYIGVAGAACLAFAGLYFALVERPVYRWLTRRLDRKPAPAAPAAGATA